MGTYLSSGVERLVHALHPWSRPQGEACFPPKLVGDIPRAKDEESIRQWFIRAVDSTLGGDLHSCLVEPRFAALASVKWRDRDQLQFVRMHAVVGEDELEDFYLDDTRASRVYYLRLDHDLSALGELFSHSQPHVHMTPWNFALRSPPDVGDTGNVIVDFVDFICRNLFHAQWMEWARATWSRSVSEAGATSQEELFDVISAAFRSSKAGVLQQEPYVSTLSRMKRTWRESRDASLPLRVPASASRLLSLHAR